MSETKRFKCTGCGEDRPCFVETNQEEVFPFGDMIVDDLKCILDETNQTSYNWEEQSAESEGSTSNNSFIKVLLNLKANGLLEGFVACEQDSVLRIKELLDLN